MKFKVSKIINEESVNTKFVQDLGPTKLETSVEFQGWFNGALVAVFRLAVRPTDIEKYPLDSQWELVPLVLNTKR